MRGDFLDVRKEKVMKHVREVWRFAVKPEVYFGNNAIQAVGRHVSRLGCKSVLIITDKALVKAGVVEKAINPLREANIAYEVFDGGEAEPSVAAAEAAIRFGKGKGAEAVIGLGGGSNMDLGKVAAIGLTYGGDVKKYFGESKVPGPLMPIIAIPTTAGTGSELTFGAVLTDPETKLKQVIADDFVRPTIAIEDPLLTLSMPPATTAETGIDALCHAIESYTDIDYAYMAPEVERVTTYGSFPITDLFAIEAIRLITKNLPLAVFQGHNVKARNGQMLGALYASLALASGAGGSLNHALGYPPAGAGIHMSHGQANAIFMLHTMEFNIPPCPEKFRNIAMAMGEQTEGLSVDEAAYKSIVAVKKLLRKVGVTKNLKDLGAKKELFPQFAEAVLKMERLLRNNPRRPSMNDVIRIYEKAYDCTYEWA
ncbi:MAG: iron-containing alcohol dehydrogenase [Thermodesulfobacteriota bacterium]|jgi:alcohol dehydrogenase